jgi:hypothetical protein
MNYVCPVGPVLSVLGLGVKESRIDPLIEDEDENEKKPRNADSKASLAAICFEEAEIMRPTRQGSALESEYPAPCGFR